MAIGMVIAFLLVAGRKPASTLHGVLPGKLLI